VSDTVTSFLRKLWPVGLPEGSRLTLWRKTDRQSLHCASLEEAINEAIRWDSAGIDVYFGVCLRHPHLSKFHLGTKNDVVACPGVWADIDCQGGVHGMDAAKLPTHEQALGVLDEFSRQFLCPTVVVNSGGGLHAYWLLDTPLLFAAGDFTRAERALKATQTRLRELMEERGWHLDNTAKIQQVLRVAGTHNYKAVTG